MANWNHDDSLQQRVLQYLLLGPIEQGVSLGRRFRESDALPEYVRKRARIVLPIGLLMVASSIAFAFGTVMFFARMGSFVTLLSLMLAPVILIVSLLVQAFVFFSWLENRAIERALKGRGRSAPGAIAAWLARRLGIRMGRMPPVPWGFGVLFIFAPLVMLARVSLPVALLVLVLQILAPFVYARLDR